MSLFYSGPIRLINPAYTEMPRVIMEGPDVTLSDPDIRPVGDYLIPGCFYEIKYIHESDDLRSAGAVENRIGEVFQATVPVAPDVQSGETVLRQVQGVFASACRDTPILSSTKARGNMSGDATGLYPNDVNEMLAQVAASGRLLVSGYTVNRSLPFSASKNCDISATVRAVYSLESGQTGVQFEMLLPVEYDGQFRNCMVKFINPDGRIFHGKSLGAYIETNTLIMEGDLSLVVPDAAMIIHSMPLPGTIWMAINNRGNIPSGLKEGDLIMATLPGLGDTPSQDNALYTAFEDFGCWMRIQPKEGALLETFVTIPGMNIYPGGLYIGTRPDTAPVPGGAPCSLNWSPITEAVSALSSINAQPDRYSKLQEENQHTLWAHFTDSTLRKFTIDVLATDGLLCTMHTVQVAVSRQGGTFNVLDNLYSPTLIPYNSFEGAYGMLPTVRVVVETWDRGGGSAEPRLFLETFLKPVAPDFNRHAYYNPETKVTADKRVWTMSAPSYPEEWGISTIYAFMNFVSISDHAPDYFYYQAIRNTPENWVGGTSYLKDTYVRYDDGMGTVSFYRALEDNSSMTVPPSDPTNWEVVDLKPGAGTDADVFWQAVLLFPGSEVGSAFWTEVIFDNQMIYRAQVKWVDCTFPMPI